MPVESVTVLADIPLQREKQIEIFVETCRPLKKGPPVRKNKFSYYVHALLTGATEMENSDKSENYDF